ncbi:MAG TPA: hypothetical protein VFM05_00505 [Candidatus Saccharimonadales bacterium]|nr:hypothetical protein [Candidatus Saccharimonadales bacterium]
MNKRTSKREEAQEGRELENRCWEYLKPLLGELHRKVDRRLVKTLLDLVFVILIHRNRNSGLLLSELGDHLLGGERGPAGVKRIANLIHSVKWKSRLIVNYLWKRADEKVKELRRRRRESMRSGMKASCRRARACRRTGCVRFVPQKQPV